MSGAATPHAFVSLLDVLGYRNKIHSDRENGREEFKDNLLSSLSVLSSINEMEMSYQAISDTIIFSAIGSSGFEKFLKHNSDVHLSFLRNGLFVRGGISFAPHFKSGSLTYSHALPISYEIEQRQAVYPRIVIDRNIIEMLKPGGLLADQSASITSQELICEENGVFFLNFVGSDLKDYYDLSREIYESDREFLQGKEHELAKHRWLQNFIVSMSGKKLNPYIAPVRVFKS
ncbi:hypothetical protein [Leisingera aquaemixtae]|uniref:Uncharacterized protein n=1 Tax=Leisingera aquaemixtae TaxID=1396826 RepID=A0A0P1HEJ3_9RHOB|nr:hypothetical protein [Leisingera aquaemixtae]CUI01950.1 hypothetical protein PHA8399_04106 [Leisingera aquaemixtae]